MVRTEPTADDSLAAILERSKFGMAMAAMIRMIATTISNSIREKPFCFFMRLNLLGSFYGAKAHRTKGNGDATLGDFDAEIRQRCKTFRFLELRVSESV